ncbi:MAG TPA: hypothetical protein DEH78_29070 [Solibacterales bacterium]|nr:hypothetical protein [Bryobacterales bacterium]
MIVSGGRAPIGQMATVQALARIADELGPSYPLILIDAPPVQQGSLTLACGPAAPHAVLVVKAGATSTQTLERVRNLLTLHGIGLAGAILNGHRSYMPAWLHRLLSR